MASKFNEMTESILKHLTEMPLVDMQKIGKGWNDKKNRHNYDKASVGILSAPSGLKRIEKVFNRVQDYDFALYFLKQQGAGQHSEIGKVTPQQIKQYFGLEVGKDIPDHSNDDVITVIFTNNKAAERVPLTPWTIAHRIGHAMRRSDVNAVAYNEREITKCIRGILEYGYGVDSARLRDFVNLGDLDRTQYKPHIRKIFESIGKFRSARTNQLSRPFEFVFECFAQQLVNGDISFNPLPDVINVKGGYSLKLQNRDYGEEWVESLAYAMREWSEYLLGTHINSISVM
jgi:hypothetical protein